MATNRKPITYRDSFIVRIWREEGEPGWRGWVQHVHSGETALVRSPAELMAFLERQIGRSASTPVGISKK